MSNFALYLWRDRFKRDGLTASLRLELRDVLAPKVSLSEPFHWGFIDETLRAPSGMKQLVDWELVLTADHIDAVIRTIDDQTWRETIPHLLGDFQQLLHDALDLLNELGEADYFSDRSHYDLPSIEAHPQNRTFKEWVILIELLRDSWLEVRESEPERAMRIARVWFDLPYPTFKRLAFYAACQNDFISDEEWTAWLIADDAWWLWTSGTRRETIRLLVLRGGGMSSDAKSKLEAAILAGPPRRMYRDDLDTLRWKSLVEHAIWFRLAKLHSSGLVLGDAASRRLAELSNLNPDWELSNNERDEFPFWVSGTGDPDFEDSRVIDFAPRVHDELVDWLKKPVPTEQPFYEDNWYETCMSQFALSIRALFELAQQDIWPEERWGVAFQAWAQENKPRWSWKLSADVLQMMPKSVLQNISHSVTRWLEAVSKTIVQDEDAFLGTCQKLLGLQHDDGVDSREHLDRALNHPIGHLTRALLNLWFKREPRDNDNLPSKLKPIFTQLCETRMIQFRHGRVILASRLIAFFRIDRDWTEANLLPLFDWATDHTEATAVWEGFLWSPRLHQELLVELKPKFLETAHHYDELGDLKRHYAALLTYVALDQMVGYTVEDLRTSIEALPQEGKEEVALTLANAIAGAAAQREKYWQNRVQPFWQHIWPKSLGLVSDPIANALARVCIAAGGEFPAAVSAVINWLVPLEFPDFVVQRLYESGLAERFPEDALRLLDRTIVDQPWPAHELAKCLTTIKEREPGLKHDPRYMRLAEYARTHQLEF